MIKNIVKIMLCIFSLAGFLLVAVRSATNFSPDTIYRSITSVGIGPSGAALKYIEPPNAVLPQPYTYINLPKQMEQPLAMILYDKISAETDLPQGQDSPETSTPAPSAPETDDTPQPLPEGTFPVISLDMSENQSIENLTYKNESKYTPDINKLANTEYPLKYSKTISTNNVVQPLVLIIHTHGTECYLPEGTDTYTANTSTRTQNTEQNVVAVGKILADVLNQNGVSTLHCETMFDAESYSESYNLSEAAVMEYIKQYPSIQYVFDVHRDSIVTENKEKVKPVTVIDGIPTAQAMFVVGTDSSGANHPDWINNLTVASIFQYALIKNYGNIMRPLNLRAASFNAEHAPGSILIEIGTCGNTVSEAKNCAALLGKTIADIILADGL